MFLLELKPVEVKYALRLMPLESAPAISRFSSACGSVKRTHITKKLRLYWSKLITESGYLPELISIVGTELRETVSICSADALNWGMNAFLYLVLDDTKWF
jgi:hypothetical protein